VCDFRPAHKLAETAETSGEARAALLAYWDHHGRTHFRREEEVLLPAYAGHGDPYHPLVARALCYQVATRHRIDMLTRDPLPAVADSTSLALAWLTASGSRSVSCFRSSSA
jgi:hypothetical protein